MTLRELSAAEWGKLDGTELGTALARMGPTDARVLVVEDAGEIIGCWGLVTMLHAEGIWIAPAHRGKTSVARRLWLGMQQFVRSLGGSSVITAAVDPGLRRLLELHGAKRLPTSYLLPW